MRVHSDRLTKADILTAGLRAGVIIHELTEHRSQSRKRAFNFYAEGRGRSRGQWGSQQFKAATWDEWGILIAALYERDPYAHWGKNSYQDAVHFHWATCERFRTLTADQIHVKHQWTGQARSAAGGYHVAECKKCDAHVRWLAPGVTWQQFLNGNTL